jgi:hypothetical protein
MDFHCPDILSPDPATIPNDETRKVYDYGRALWFELAEARRYLRDCVAGGDISQLDAQEDADRPLLRDDGSWMQWATLYAQICGTLAGTSGDRGFGRGEAVLIARSHGVALNSAPRSGSTSSFR